MGLTEAGKAISQLQGTWVQTIQLCEGNGLPSGEGLPLNPPHQEAASGAEQSPRKGNRRAQVCNAEGLPWRCLNPRGVGVRCGGAAAITTDRGLILARCPARQRGHSGKHDNPHRPYNLFNKTRMIMCCITYFQHETACCQHSQIKCSSRTLSWF